MSSKLNISNPEREYQKRCFKAIKEIEEIIDKHNLGVMEVLDISRFLTDSSILQILDKTIITGVQN